MTLAYKENEEWKYWNESIFRPKDGELFRLPSSAEHTYPKETLESFGLFPILSEDSPEGPGNFTKKLVDRNGSPREIYVIEE